MGNTYARLWAVVPEEKRYFVDPPFINEFYRIVADFIIGFPTDFPDESVLKFSEPLIWNTLVYEEDLLACRYPSLWDSSKDYGYVNRAPEGFYSEEKFEDGTCHLEFDHDDQDRRRFTVRTMRQLAIVMSLTKKTWDMEIASMLYFHPDPVGRVFGKRYDVSDIPDEDMLDGVSSKSALKHSVFSRNDLDHHLS